MKLILNAELKKYFPVTAAGFDQIMALKGEVYRSLEGRKTQRVTIGNHTYFIKQHKGVGWKEILKNILQLRLPIISAKNEWQALQKLERLNVSAPEVIGYGSRGINPATRQSFIITRELSENNSLEHLGREWQDQPPAFKYKLKVIKEVARIASVLHTNGINHRDFYICHLLLDLSMPSQLIPRLYLIDLHRAGLHKHLAERWIIKDLAGIYFSSKEVGLTKRDLFRFMRDYSGATLRDVIENKTLFWRKVQKRGDKLFREHQ